MSHSSLSVWPLAAYVGRLCVRRGIRRMSRLELQPIKVSMFKKIFYGSIAFGRAGTKAEKCYCCLTRPCVSPADAKPHVVCSNQTFSFCFLALLTNTSPTINKIKRNTKNIGASDSDLPCENETNHPKKAMADMIIKIIPAIFMLFILMSYFL